MKCSIKWLKTWVSATVSPKVLGDVLTAGGLELDSMTVVGDDHWIELGVTPNRGDCLSVQGVAREAAALLEAEFIPLSIDPVVPSVSDTWPVVVKDSAACLRYFSRRITGVNAAAKTPQWILERLQSTGMKSVSIVVDIANYVMMELGQPLHAFDAAMLEGTVCVRQSNNEKITLIDNSTVTLDDKTCVIADEKKVLAIAGVMGCADSGVTPHTTDLLIESAFFLPSAVRGRARQYRVSSDAAMRFERGVDPTLAERALERVTALILEAAGGHAGPVQRIEAAALPSSVKTVLPMSLLKSRLGIEIDISTAASLLKRLHMVCDVKGDAITVVPPSFRFDIQIPEDLVEEVARVYGYDRIPEALPPIVPASTASESATPLGRLKDVLVDRGYQEVITYSFVDESLQRALFPSVVPIALLNPLSPDMAVMRHSLLLGLLQTALYNQARQINSMRLFEAGQCFDGGLPDVRFEEHLALLICGQTEGFWQQQKPRSYDFYDLKGDVEALLSFNPKATHFVPTDHPVLARGKRRPLSRAGIPLGCWVRCILDY